MDIIEKLKKINLKEYIEKKTSQSAFSVGSGTYRFKNCPICKGGDHFNINASTNLWNTFGNCGGGSIIDFYMAYYGLNKDIAIKDLCKENNIISANEVKAIKEVKNMSNSGKEKDKLKGCQNSDNHTKDNIKPKQTQHVDLTPPINNYYTTHESNYNYFTERLLKNFEYDERSLTNNFNRIIAKNKIIVGSIKTVLKDHDDVIPKFYNIDTYEYIIPVWRNGKAVNCILRRNDKKSTDNCKTTNLKGLNIEFFNIDYLKQNKLKVFITEGIFDCLSLEMMGYNSICINSTHHANKLIEQIKKNIKTINNTTFILAMDNDEEGIKATKKIAEELRNINVKYLQLQSNKYKDINDWYLNDLQGVRTAIKEICKPKTVLNYLDTFLDNIEKNKNIPVIETGFSGLDTLFNGGMYPGLYCLGAISSLGKTAFTLQLADQIAEQKNHVLFFSLEMPKDELISRSISRTMFLLNTDNREIGTIRVMNKLIDNCENDFNLAIEKYKETIAQYLNIVEGNFDYNINNIVDYVKKYIEFTEIKPVVFIDYLQIVKPSKDDRIKTEKQAIDDIVVKLKMLSRDYKIPVFVVSSFNRENYNNPVAFTCFKESGGIEYTSDFVLGLQLSILDNENIMDMDNKAKKQDILHKAKDDNPRQVTCVILKNRNGKSFTKQKFKFYPKNNLFREV